MKNIIITIRIILWSLVVFIITGFLYLAIVPSGEIEYSFDFNKKNGFIGKLKPEERLQFSDKKFRNKIIANPVYFNLYTPRPFETAELEIKYKNKGDISLLEAGVLVDNISWNYDLKPVQNKLIDQLSLVWEKKNENNLLILKRPDDASSTYECNFFNNNATSTDINNLAVYNYKPKITYVLNDYEAGNGELKDLNNFHPLRASWQINTYIKSETLNFNFSFQDLNLNKDENSIDLLLFYEDELIDSHNLSLEDVQTQEKLNLEFKLANLPEGLYKIVLRASDDIITTNIKTAQSKLVFINKLRLFKNNNSDGFSLFTNSKKIQSKTIYPDSLQKIKIEKEELNLKETYHQFESDISHLVATSGIKMLDIKKDGIFLSGDGVFSFSYNNFFNPKIKKAIKGINVNNSNINCIIADYKIPFKNDDCYIAHVFFNLKKAYRENNIYSFMISAPDLKMDDDWDDYLEIEQIKVKLRGRSLKEKISSIIGK